MNEKRDNLRFTLGPVATELALEAAQDAAVTRQHLDEAIIELQVRASQPRPSAEPQTEFGRLEHTVEKLAGGIEVLAADLMHLRFMIVALNAPDEEHLVREMDRANNEFVTRTQEKLTALGIPQDKRLTALDILRERLQMDRGDNEMDHDEER